MKRKLFTLFVFAVLLFSHTMLAQTRTVNGTVTDQSGVPLPGVSIAIKNTTQGVSTDFEGRYSIVVKQGDILVFSYVGFSTQEKNIAGGSGALTINVTLKEDTQELGEVVVTALGIKRSEKALGYALQEVDGTKLLESRDANVTNALSGKVSGLQIVKGAGGMAGSSKIILRGQNSLTGDNQPLIVVDGVPIDNKASGAADIWGNSGMDMGNGLQDINPEDIESVSILKGASAAALYGSRAGNGVILITTKSGKSQQGLGISISSTVATEDIFIKPKLQNSYGQGVDEIYNPKTTQNWGPRVEGN